MSQKVDFDKYAESYRTNLNNCFTPFHTTDIFFDEYKVRCIKEFVADKNTSYDILDYGCGVGKISGLLAKEFSRSEVYGWDISKESLNVARRENSDFANVHFFDELPRDKKYDLLLVTMVFHHIEPDLRADILRQMESILKPGGKIIIFEHNPLNPATQYIVKNCVSDADARLILRSRFIKLAENCGFRIALKRYILFFPWRAEIFRKIERLLKFMPFGAQYMIVLASKQP